MPDASLCAQVFNGFVINGRHRLPLCYVHRDACGGIESASLESALERWAFDARYEVRGVTRAAVGEYAGAVVYDAAGEPAGVVYAESYSGPWPADGTPVIAGE